VALGVAQLVAEGKIKSFDQPVADFYPEWRQGRKKNITIRMLMNHTSSMQNVMNATVEIYPAPDSRRGFTSLQRSIAAESPFAGKFVLLASEYLCRANKLPAEFADFYGNVAMDLLAEGARSRDAPRRV
jgi:CubicO group peptidase (beta-lactamase class C family)